MIGTKKCVPVRYRIVPHRNKLPITKPDYRGSYQYLYVNDSSLIKTPLITSPYSDIFYAPQD